MLYIFTGDGKGKTTAALGTAMRATGEGRRVLMVQFIKGPWKSGEDEAHKNLAPHFKLVKMGLGFVGILGDTLPRSAHERAAQDALAYAAGEAAGGAWDIIILDEIHNALHLRLIALEKVLDFIRNAAGKTEHIILTGRDAPRELIDMADLVTEMRDIKHPYDKGFKAKRGLEY
jgi:cob(I)alamin adenosyltransferase